MEARERKRCGWCMKDSLYLKYHDTEWGVQLHDDQRIFEFLALEGMQAGLSWLTILKKREGFRRAFDRFIPTKVASYDDGKIVKLMNDKNIIRNRAKIYAVINNAARFIEIQEEFGSFDSYMWGFVGGRQKKNKRGRLSDIPSRTPESDRLSRDLVLRGFKFVGPTICYSHMQATGMVNDHLYSCFRYDEV